MPALCQAWVGCGHRCEADTLLWGGGALSTSGHWGERSVNKLLRASGLEFWILPGVPRGLEGTFFFFRERENDTDLLFY